MGKVGSTSVMRTLQALELPAPVVHCHTLEPQRTERAIARTQSSNNPAFSRHLFISRILARKLAAGSVPCRVITLTREPVARAVSFVFEDWRKQAPEARKGDRLDVATMQTAVNGLLAGENGISDPTRWFDSELKAVFGIDVFSKPYDFERGYVTYSSGAVSALLMRAEDLDRSLPQALRDFLQVELTQIPRVSANRAKFKWYANSLAEFRADFQLKSELRERVESTRYARHFYPSDLVSSAL